MSRRKRFAPIEDLQEQFDILAAWDYYIVCFNEYHYRINGELDIWPTARTAYNIRHHVHEEFYDGDLVSMVRGVLPTKSTI